MKTRWHAFWFAEEKALGLRGFEWHEQLNEIFINCSDGAVWLKLNERKWDFFSCNFPSMKTWLANQLTCIISSLLRIINVRRWVHVYCSCSYPHLYPNISNKRLVCWQLILFLFDLICRLWNPTRFNANKKVFVYRFFQPMRKKTYEQREETKPTVR